jgi:hypothetical protein
MERRCIESTGHGECPFYQRGWDQDEGYTDKKENGIFLIYMEQLQSHIWLTAASCLVKYFGMSSYIRKPFLIFDLQLLHSEFPYTVYDENFIVFFISVVIRERTLNYHYLLALCVCDSWRKLSEGGRCWSGCITIYVYYIGGALFPFLYRGSTIL